jgi:NitT/TauT family transport system substrate-binding protein
MCGTNIRRTFIGGFVALLLSLSAAGAQTLPVVRVATSANDAAAVVYYAQALGYFKRAGIDVQIQALNNGGAALAAAVVSGSIDVAVSNVLSLATAHMRGVPVVLVAPSALYESAAPTTALAVSSDSTVMSARDLNGKTVATGGLNDLSEVTAKAWIDEHGGDSKTVSYIEIPFVQMAAALARGTVQAAVMTEPYLTDGHDKLRIIGKPYDAVGQRFLINGWFSSEQWVTEHPGLASRFAAALANAATWANAHHSESAAILVRYSPIAPPVLDRMTRATYGTSLRAADIQPTIAVGVKYGGLTAPFPGGDLIASSAGKP